MDKLNELKKKIEEIQTKSLVAGDMKQFITLVLSVVTKTKEELANLSAENIKVIKDSIAYIESYHEKHINDLVDKTNTATGQFDAKLGLLKALLAKVEAIKATPGRDGLDGYTPVKGVDYFDGIGKDGKDGSPDTRIQIVEKINLGKKKDLKIELAQIEDFSKLEKSISDRALSILDQRTQFLINKGVKHDDTLSGEGTDANPLTVIGGGGTIDGSGTANEITYWVDSDTLGALAVATYPSLTELSYVKGVTSAIQTQLGAKVPYTGATGNVDLGGNTLTVGNILIAAGGGFDFSDGLGGTRLSTYSDSNGIYGIVGTGGAALLDFNSITTDKTFTFPNASGILLTDVSTASALTSLGVLTTLTVDNILINGNDISSIAGVDLTITPLAGQQIVLDGTIVIDAGVVTGATSITSTAFVGALTGNADSATTLTGLTSSVAELNILDGATLTVTELNFVDGVTSAIQTQLDARLPLAGGTMSGNITLGENAEIILDEVLSADGKYTGTAINGTAGTALAFGDLIYLAVADSRWELADADALATAGGVLMGFCVLAAAADGSATKILLSGTIRADTAFPALTIGANVYVGTTAGDIQVAAPSGSADIVRVVGQALDGNSLVVNISPNYITIV